MKYKNIIFDFDGTLVDTAPVILAAMAATFDELGLPAPSVEKCKSVIGLRLEDIGSKLYPDIVGINGKFAEVYQRVFRTVNRPGEAKPFPGVIETLRELKAEGLNLAIASSRKHFSLEDFIKDLHLEGLFDMVVGGDDVKHGKPSPDPVNAIIEALGWKADETLVVGDAGVDIMMGKAAGCDTCGVSYGNGTLRELHEAGADYVTDTFPTLKEIVSSR